MTALRFPPVSEALLFRQNNSLDFAQKFYQAKKSAAVSHLYATEAIGPFVGFEAGWLMWLTRLTGFADNCNSLVSWRIKNSRRI